jgi:malonate-semialdehyde dehydrogenase (acetylating)/methylmalonate-semialdehyde dehydrogenase
LIQSCEDQGGKILLDGRNVKVPGFEEGNFVGPTILEATTDMDCYQCVDFVFLSSPGKVLD